MLPAVLVLGLASVCTACSPVRVAMRADVTTIPISSRLEGLQVAVSKVRDLRSDRVVLGHHRDGFARVTQYDYASGTNVRTFVKRLAELSLLASGATLADPNTAEIRVEIDVLSADVTTDGALAGEETFGTVKLSFRYLDRGNQLLGEKVIERRFENEELNDRGLLGDALKDAVLAGLQQVRPKDKSEDPPASELAGR